MDLTVIIVNFNTQKLLQDCLKSILDKRWKHNIQVVVVDNASTDDSVKMVRRYFPKVMIIESKKNLGFAGGNNLALQQTHPRYYLLLNSDTLVLLSSLDCLIEFMDRSEFAIGSGKLLNLDGTFQPNAGDLPFGLSLFFWISGWDDIVPFWRKKLPSFHQKVASFYQGEKEVGWVSGSVMIIKKELIDKIGKLDENIFMYGEDVEYCLRAKRAGFKIGWTDQVQIIHLGGGSLENKLSSQWIGEFKGLLYIYKKYLGTPSSILLNILIRFFITIRVLAFLIVGKISHSQTYAKILLRL